MSEHLTSTRNRRKRIFHRSVKTVLLLVLIVVVGCEDEQADGRTEPLWAPPGAPCPVNPYYYWTPQETWLGAVDVLNDRDELFIEVIGTGGTMLLDVQLWVGVGTPPSDWTTYPYQRDFSASPVPKTRFDIPLSELSVGCATELNIVAHGRAIKDGVEKIGWSYGTPLPGTDGWYITYRICCDCGDGGVAPGDDSVCNGADDDCDGLVDEWFTSESTTCGSGSCSGTGSTSCVDGEVVDSCSATGSSSDAACDGLDDDCDGTLDEDYSPTATSCGTGACAATGSTSCVGGAVQDSCSPGTPASSERQFVPVHGSDRQVQPRWSDGDD